MVATGISVGRIGRKGFPTTKRAKVTKTQKPSKHRVVKDIVEEAIGVAPYEARLVDLVEVSEKRALRFAKRRLGDLTRAKKKIRAIEDLKRRIRKRQQERIAEQTKQAEKK
ncbi:ribosomal protein L36E [Naegleria gruberi]|uniref:Ribosomal protein L36E n=1 Tax=Naegleria gruberi TaxID=5762 RepID=D2VJ88_NAEGR|nr:ribosomal protein L36E [Naegleria gruberi]EFC43240.1 ribosomal protein L36E [Naegleria gruberi]|eukprot:XP_002675984.1 ribosomal protein L36E [Naegleria gruberi strain NEG-M]